MRAFFHSQGLEFTLETLEESWAQGDSLKGTVTLVNNSAKPFPLESVHLSLKQCLIKDIRAKEHEGALVCEASLVDQPQALEVGKTAEFKFNLAIPLNQSITDNKSSLYLFYGIGEQQDHLQLQISPLQDFLDMVKVLETFFRFKVKKVQSKKGVVEFTFSPPSSREWSSLKTLHISFSLKDAKEYELKYEARGQTLDLADLTGKTKKSVLKAQHTLPRQRVMISTSVDSEYLRQHYDEVLSGFRPSWS